MCARRYMRLPRSAYSRSTRLCSFLGRYSSSSAAFASTSSARASASALACLSSAACGASATLTPVQRRARVALRRGAQLRARRRPPARARARRRRAQSRAHAWAVSGSTPVSDRRQLVGRRRVEAHRLAARQDRRQHVLRAVGQQQQVRERRRLLQRLEHPVGGVLVHRVDALDDEHAPARLERRPRRGGDDRLVDVGHEHLGRAAGRDPGEVRVHAVLRAQPRVLGIGRAVGQQRRRERARDVALARPGGAVEQVGVARRPRRRQRRRQDGARVGMTLGAREHA